MIYFELKEVLKIIKIKPIFLKNISKEEKISSEIFIIFLKQNGLALEFVPEKYKTEEMCWEAVKQDGLALEFVPEEYKNL